MASPTQMPPPPINPQWVRPPRRRSIFGPMVLIFIGVLFLLVNTGAISARNLFVIFAQYWPVLLILWGVVKLFEYMQAKREGYPPPGLGGGSIVLLVFILLFGTAISAAHRGMSQINWDNVRKDVDFGDEDLNNLFGGQKFEFSDNVDHDFPAKASLKVALDRGEIKISPSSDDKLHIALHKSLYAGSEVEAKKISDEANPTITVVDNLVTVEALPRGSWKGGSVNMEIFVPRKAAVDLMTLRGALSVVGRDGNVKANNSRGDVTLEDIAGNADVHVRGGDFKAQKVNGDVNIEGRMNNANISDLTGRLSLQGDFDEIQLSKIAKGLHFNSSRTDLDIPRLDGNLNMTRGDFRADNAFGPVRLVTKNKDIEFQDVTGDVHVENANAAVEVRAKVPVGNIDIANQRGEVNLVLPANGNFSVDATANRGEISTEFEQLKQTDDNHEARASGTVNKGGARVQVRNEHGTVNIRKQ
ncbi:MAG: hypothetical protein JWO20_1779 [Candidatus Angelobacter sp.]|jgi:DUF4097 and DUF4098 domain-containing protein YvlB|nr:hypothetical protein [Candidatus Angelobacter sp.]